MGSGLLNGINVYFDIETLTMDMSDLEVTNYKWLVKQFDGNQIPYLLCYQVIC